jgi:hypothetical protein
VAGLTPEVHLLQPLVLLFLIADVIADHFFIPANRRYEIAACPKALPDEIPPVLALGPCEMDRAFPLDEASHLRDSVFRRYRYHHVNVIGRQMPFLDPAFLLLSQFAEQVPKMAPQLRIQRLPAAFGNEHNVVFALPFAVI